MSTIRVSSDRHLGTKLLAAFSALMLCSFAAVLPAQGAPAELEATLRNGSDRTSFDSEPDAIPSAIPSPTGWTYFDKAGCFEQYRKITANGTFWKITNVCADNGETTRFTTVTMGGYRSQYCIGQHQWLHLGLTSEHKWWRTDSWPSGCKRKSAPYIVNHLPGITSNPGGDPVQEWKSTGTD